MNKILILILLFSSNLNAAVGCLGKSFDTMHERFYEKCDPSIRNSLNVYRNEENYPSDPKLWKPKECTCPCNQYEAAFFHQDNSANGLCVICHHRGPRGRKAQYRTSSVADAATLDKQLPLLKKIVARKITTERHKHNIFE
jgi:hypothetical protein